MNEENYFSSVYLKQFWKLKMFPTNIEQEWLILLVFCQKMDKLSIVLHDFDDNVASFEVFFNGTEDSVSRSPKNTLKPFFL